MNSTIYEQVCISKLKEFFGNLGYPETSFHLNYRDGKNMYDFVLYPKELDYPLAIIEISPSEILRRNGYERYKNMYSKMPKKSLFIYAYLKPNKELCMLPMTPELEKDAYLRQLENHFDMTFPTYPVLTEQHIQVQNINKNKRIRKEKDMFSIICYVDTFILMVLFILELFDFFNWTTERIIIFILIVILPLLPFFAEIKIGDYSFKRERKNKG